MLQLLNVLIETGCDCLGICSIAVTVKVRQCEDDKTSHRGDPPGYTKVTRVHRGSIPGIHRIFFFSNTRTCFLWDFQGSEFGRLQCGPTKTHVLSATPDWCAPAVVTPSLSGQLSTCGSFQADNCTFSYDNVITSRPVQTAAVRWAIIVNDGRVSHASVA